MSFERSNKDLDQMHRSSYLRSASDMAGQTSLAEQERQCRKAAEEHGWIVLDDSVRSDAGKAGTSLQSAGGFVPRDRVSYEQRTGAAE